MIYRSSDIPATFNKIAEISDNYIVWVSENVLNSGTNYNAYIQFFNPSFSYIYIEDYQIKNGTNYIYNANYVNNGIYTYIDYYDVDYSLNTYVVDIDYITDNDFTRSDYGSIFIMGFILVAIFTILLVRLIPHTRY